MELLLLEKTTFYGILIAIILIILISIKIHGKRLKLPPSPALSIPVFGNWLQVGNDLNHLKLTEYAKNLGDIFLLKLGQRNLVLVSSPDLAKDVLHTHGIVFGSRWRNVVWDIFIDKGQDLVFSDYGDHWKKMRRIMSVAFFSRKATQQFRKAWEEEASEVIKEVRKNPKARTEGIVLRNRLQLMVYNNAYRAMFDKRFENEEDPLYIKLKGLNGERSRLTQNFGYNYGDFIPILRPFLRGYLKICKEVRDQRLQLFKDYFVDPRRTVIASMDINKAQSIPCGIDDFLESQQTGEITEDQVLLVVENINLAAIETTLWPIEWAIAELVNYPDIQRKVRNELDNVLGPNVSVTEPDTYKLPYLEAVIKETLRLHNVNPFLVPHSNLDDAKLGGYDIPAKSKVLVNSWWLSNNPAHWKNPQEFRPERFLEEESNVEPNGNDFRYIPFGAGRRSCPGVAIALAIIGITLGNLVTNFELLPPPGTLKIDTAAIGGQIALRIRDHSRIVLKSRSDGPDQER